MIKRLRSWYYRRILFHVIAWRESRAFYRKHGPIVKVEPMPRTPDAPRRPRPRPKK